MVMMRKEDKVSYEQATCVETYRVNNCKTKEGRLYMSVVESVLFVCTTDLQSCQLKRFKIQKRPTLLKRGLNVWEAPAACVRQSLHLWWTSNNIYLLDMTDLRAFGGISWIFNVFTAHMCYASD